MSAEFQNIQIIKYPGSAKEAEEVKSASDEINPEILTLDQKEAVKSFFAKGANLLEKMN